MTTEATPQAITLKNFADSLMPGKGRTDNLFKFLGAYDDEEIAKFLSELFDLSGLIVDGAAGPEDLEQLILRHEIAARTRTVQRRTGPGGLPSDPLEGPAWTQLEKALKESKIALLTSGAIRRPVDQSFLAPGATYEEAIANQNKAYDRTPMLRVMPGDLDVSSLIVEHIAYDIRAAKRDINVIFPIERLRELAASGLIGGIADYHYSFSGLTNMQRLTEEAAPAWAKQIAADRPDAVVLTPGWPMCTVSVGYVARALEQEGVPTVSIYPVAFRAVLEHLKPPRAIVNYRLMGRPLGQPGDAEEQRSVLAAALQLLERATVPGTIVEYKRWRVASKEIGRVWSSSLTKGIHGSRGKECALTDTPVPSGLDPSVLRREVSLEVRTEHIEKMLHKAEVHGFTYYSDEPERMGGENNYPYPLDYFAGAVGLWLLTQMVRYGHMLKANLKNIRVKVRMSWVSEGSVLAGTISSKCLGVESDLEVESDDDPALVAALIHSAKGGCYAEAALSQPLEVKSTAMLNGQAFDFTRYPLKPPARWRIEVNE